MKLKRLIDPLESVTVHGSKEVEITGLCSHSQFVSPGNLFVAKKGLVHDGTRFIGDAVAAGASAILTDLYDPFLALPQLIHPNVAAIEALLADHYYGHPSRQMKVVGVTGTNGKTTVSFLVEHMLKKLGLPTGLIGTVEWRVGDQCLSAAGTTPDVITCHKLLREMVSAGCQAAVMEVSSHGLHQGRAAEIAFDVAAFTNLSPEHLDYHGSMDAYAEAKSILFQQLDEGGVAVLNGDDPTRFTTLARQLNYGINPDAELRAEEVTLKEKGLSFTVVYREARARVSSKLIGRFNVSNLLAAIGVGLGLGYSLEACVESLKGFKGVKGRLQQVPNSLKRTVVIDYAHTPDALKNVLMTVRDFAKGKVIVVFGAGGDRDQEKRPLMGEVADDLADLSILTNDNPRTEDPLEIVQAIASGYQKGKPVIEFDRKEAIAKAISFSNEGDLILIAGKGHETGQVFAHQVLPFDDFEVANQICKEVGGVCRN